MRSGAGGCLFSISITYTKARHVCTGGAQAKRICIQGLFFPEWAARAHFPYIRTKHASPTHLLATLATITDVDTVAATRSCTDGLCVHVEPPAVSNGRRKAELCLLQGLLSTSTTRAVSSGADDLWTSITPDVRAYGRPGDHDEKERNHRNRYIRLASA